MQVAVIADAHLGGPGGGATPLVHQLSELPQLGCRWLIFLGDLFHIWVGDKRFETAEIKEVSTTLAELRDQGVRLSYVEGNRDFFVATSPYAELFDDIGEELTFELGGRKYLAVHGDGLDDRDWKYRFWRAISKSRGCRFFARRLPASLAGWVARGTEARLARTNFKHRREIPEAVIRNYASRRFREGHDVLLLGHFHEPRHLHLPVGEVRLLNAWFRDHRLEWISE